MGTLSSMSAVDLGVLSVKELLNRAGIEPGSGVVDEVVFGQVLQAGAGQNPARQVALGAGLPVSTPCGDRQQGLWVFLEGGDDGGQQHSCW